MQTRKEQTLEKVERFMEERKITSIINMHKESHEKEIDQLQNDFKIKIKKLQKQLIAKKSSLKDNPYNVNGTNDPMFAKTGKRSKQSIKTIITNVAKHSEYDTRIEKIMQKLESKYDINEEIHIANKQFIIERRQRIIEDILTEMMKNIKDREKLIYDNNGSRGMSAEEIVKEKEILFQQRLNAKMLQYMIENQYFQNFQVSNKDIEIQSVQKAQNKQNSFNFDQLSDPQQQLYDNVRLQTEKRNIIKQNIKFHLNRIGVLPKRISGTSITIEEMKNAQIQKPKLSLNLDQIRLPNIERKKSNGQSTNRYTEDDLMKQSVISPQSKCGILTDREIEIKNIEELQDECSAAHNNLQKLGKSIVSKKKRQDKKYNSMNLKLNQVKHSSFLDSKLMIIDLL